MPAAPANLLKVLAEDPSTFEKEIGCITGILQIFDRHHTFTGRRYGSERVTTANGEAFPAACESPPHDPSNLSAYKMFQDLVQEPGESLHSTDGPKIFLEHSKSSQWGSQKNGEFFTNSSSTPPQKVSSCRLSEGNVTSHRSFYFKGQTSHTSERKTIQTAAPRHSCSVQGETPRVCAAQPRASDKYVTESSSLDIRDIVRESFHRDKPRMPVDSATNEVISGLIHLKNLSRSSSVDGRKEYSMSLTEFPRSTFANAGTTSPLDGKEPTCTQRLQIRRGNPEPPRSLTKPRRSFDGNEVPRLTVELEEGPRLGSFKHTRGKSLDGQELRRPLVLNDPSKYDRYATTYAAFEFREFLRAADFRDSLRASQKGKDAHRSSVDETPDFLDVSVTPRLSIVGRDPPQLREQPSLQDESASRGRGSNVIARLMGLEEFPSPPAENDCKEAQFRDSSPKPPSQEIMCTPAGSLQCRERDEHFSALNEGDEGKNERLGRLEAYGDGQSRVRSPLFRQQEAREALMSRLANKSKKHFCEDEPLQSLQSSKSSSPSHEPLHGDMVQRLQQRLRSHDSAHERNILKQILEAIQLKGVVHPPRHKVSQASPPITDTNPRWEESKPQNRDMKGQQNASPNFSLRKLAHMELEYQVKDSALIESRIKQSSQDQNIAHKHDRETSIVIMKPRHTKVNGAPLSKDLECVSRISGSSERSMTTAAARASRENGGPVKIACGRTSNQTRPSRAQRKGHRDTRDTRLASSSSPKASVKSRSSPGREPHPPKPPLPAKAAFGSTSTRMPDTPQGRGSHLKDREESRAALVTLRNRSKTDWRHKGRVKKHFVPDEKLKAQNKDSPTAQNAKVPVEVVILRCKPAGKTANKRIPSPGKEPGKVTSSSEPMDEPKPCERRSTVLDGNHGAWQEVCQIRVNAGAAVDQSGDGNPPDSFVNSHGPDSASFDTRARLQALKEQILPAKEGKTQKAVDTNKEQADVTPRGVSVKRSQVHESGQGMERVEQPSPVSVLDSTVFVEECTPSPSAGNTIAINLQDAFEALECAHHWNELATQELHHLAKVSSTAVEFNHLSSSSTLKDGISRSRQKPVELIQLPYDTNAMRDHRTGASLADRDEEREFVRDLLVISGVTKENWVGETSPPARGYVIDPAMLAMSEQQCQQANLKALAYHVGNVVLKAGWCKREQENKKEMLDRRTLFDTVNELLAQKLTLQANPQPWVNLTPPRVLRKPEGQNLVQKIWEEVQTIPCATSDEVCVIVQIVLQKDLGSQGPDWTDFGTEFGEVCFDLETMIYKDLVEEVVKQLTCSNTREKTLKLTEGSYGPRRQLFPV